MSASTNRKFLASRFHQLFGDFKVFSWYARPRNRILQLRRSFQRCITVAPKYFGISTWMITLPFIPKVHALSFGFGQSKEQDKSESEVISEKADRLYEETKVMELYDFLIKYKDLNDPEILWRLARATCDKGKLSRDNEKRKQCMFEAFEYSKQAIVLDENSFACNKWYAILLDYTAEYEGTKVRILNSYKVKDHFLKAIELNPKDATSIYSLGYWCFVFADLPWYQRKLASTLLATPPSSTYEEALKYFHLAEKVEPNFYSMNLLMLGKTYQRLGQKDVAITYLIKARDYPVQTTDDEQAHKEAVDLLKQYGVKTDS
ncbi:hypothetical protein LOTGIDRAFT_187255 [Lottia gigantea]|uniref:Regulator of microtubule dynamics protein 1 n=1 Tax=Lottia gigantea TaxID=225164 RepID=V4AM25_LOTGI|nr:hypothetical protein LOTGIDRAFT_187255 [Lottia gigantea]ESO98182.1 hypothetical protein LOTGIDRAFT_187255 [Lottia gigantea]